MVEYLLNSFIVTAHHHRRAGRHRDPRRLRVRVPRVPVQAHAVRRVPRHVDGAVRGHVRHEPRRRSATSGWYDTLRSGLAVPFLATGFGAFLHAPGVPQLPHDLQDAAALDGYGHWRFMTRVAVPLARRRSRRSPSSPSSPRGTSTCGRCWSRRTTQLRTVQIGLKQLRGYEHRPGQRHVRGHGARGAPARHPAAGVPEAAGPRA